MYICDKQNSDARQANLTPNQQDHPSVLTVLNPHLNFRLPEPVVSRNPVMRNVLSQQMDRPTVIRQPLNNVDNDRENQYTMQKATKNNAFLTWEQWWSCWRKLKNSDAMEVLRASSHFYRCMSFSCPYCTTTDEDFLNHLLEHHEGEDIVCSYCLKGSFTPETLISHSQEHLPCVYQCPQCIYRACRYPYVIQHQNTYHGMAEKVWKCPWFLPAMSLQYSEAHIQPYCCTDCSFQSRNVEEFGLHQAIHPSTSCFYCNRLTSSFNDLLQHLRGHGINDYHCYYCQFGTETREKLIDHMCINHPEKPPQICSRVDRVTTNNEIQKICSSEESCENNENKSNFLIQHNEKKESNVPRCREERKIDESQQKRSGDDVGKFLLDSSGQKMCGPVIFCPLCKKICSSKKDLRDHMAFAHHITEIHICYTCNKYFESQALLEMHNFQHHPVGKVSFDEISYMCVFCNFVSNDLVQMSNHMQKEILEGKGAVRSVWMSAEIDAWINMYLKAQQNPPTPGRLVPSQIRIVGYNVCPMCHLDCGSSHACMEHVCYHMQYRPYKCTKCDQSFACHKKAIKHASTDHSEVVKPLRCLNLFFVENWIMKMVYGKNTGRWPVHYCGNCKFKNRKIRLLLKHFEKNHPNVPLDIREEKYLHNPETLPHKHPEGTSDLTSSRDVPQDNGQPGASLHNNPEALVVHKNSSASNGASKKQQKEREHDVIRTSKIQSSEMFDNTGESTFSSDSNETEPELVNLKCSICTFETANLEDFKDHCKSNHRSKVSEKHRDYKSHKHKDYKSAKKHLDKATSSKDPGNISNHEPTKISKILKCPLCRYLATSITKLSRHTKKKHSSCKPPASLISDKEILDPYETVKEREGKTRKRHHTSTSASSSGLLHRKKYRRVYRKASSSDSSDDSRSLCKEDMDTSELKDVVVNSEPSSADVYWSNYGHKPKPVNCSEIFVCLDNPSDEGVVKVSLIYYRDIFFKKEPKVTLYDCKKHLATPVLPSVSRTDEF